MCDLCHHTICPRGCPNAPEPPVMAWCDLCGDGIIAGNTYYAFADKIICDTCVSMAEREMEEP